MFPSHDRGGVDSVTIASNDVEKFLFKGKVIEPQKLIREVKLPVTDSVKTPTNPGYTGLLVDGVEILNYKSKDFVYYGILESINVIKGGENFDVINPPVIGINDNVGSGATAVSAIKGSLKEIKILDSGFDYIEEPVIKISGGNGRDAAAVAKLNTVPHELLINVDGS